MPSLYRNQSYQPKYNAQVNLQGRTHYVDDQTLKFHYSRIVNTFETDGGLLFALIESCTLNHQNTTRGFRYVVFDIFGHVIAKPDLDEAHKTHDKAKAAMWNALNAIDAVEDMREIIGLGNSLIFDATTARIVPWSAS